MIDPKSNSKEPARLSFDSSTHAVAPDVAVDFLKETMPFKELGDEVLYDLAKHCRIDFFPKGTRLFTYNKTEITHLHLIQRGGVRAYIIDEDGVVQHESINNMPLGRNVAEYLRIVDALTHVQEKGEVCPANWQEGKDAMAPNAKGTAEYLSSH